MILFLNFVPINFMGGTEKWMNDTAKKINVYECTKLLSMHPNIANLYGKFVVKRKYKSYVKKSEIHNHISLDMQSFIPFTKKWKDTREIFFTARLIYTRYEVLECFLVMYFSGMRGLKKTIAGIHSPFLYSEPISFFDKLHNSLYSSQIYKYIFHQVKKVHVLNTKDKKYFYEKFNSRNVVYVPNGTVSPKIMKEKFKKNKNQLRVLFVGELSMRKGVDILLQIIKSTPRNIIFTIAGDGILKKELLIAEKQFHNIVYRGYAKKDMLDTLYRQHEVLILPSRAESMSLALLEAMSYGLVIIDSIDTTLGLDRKVEYACSNKNIQSYVSTLKQLCNMKIKNTLRKSYVRDYFNANFSSLTIDMQIYKHIFEINVI
jgi:glycosyltransferase involved in cell wall biosynthesis